MFLYINKYLRELAAAANTQIKTERVPPMGAPSHIKYYNTTYRRNRPKTALPLPLIAE